MNLFHDEIETKKEVNMNTKIILMIFLLTAIVSTLCANQTLIIQLTGEAIPPILEAEIVETKPTSLLGNFPNPFNPTTSIRFEVQGSRFVNIEVYNIRGQRVRTLVNDVYQAGEHFVVWNGKDDNGQDVSSGMYFYKMQTGDFVQTKRMVIIK